MRATTGSVLLSSCVIAALAVIGPPTAGGLAAQQTLAVTAAAADRSLPATHGTPTFYADVLPILQENCQVCHQPAGRNMGGNVAPWPLVTYEDARLRAPRMATAVREGRMPPWSAAAQHKGTFANERVLEDEEKATIIAWAEGGVLAGNPADAPPTPEFLTRAAATGGWSLGDKVQGGRRIAALDANYLCRPQTARGRRPISSP